MSEPVLDTMVLQALGFGHPNGLSILFETLSVPLCRLPPEVYNRDEESVPLSQPDRELSELARGLRFAQRRAHRLPPDEAARFHRWLENARQIRARLDNGTLRIDALKIASLRLREELVAEHGIGRGEAACLALALETDSAAVFVSSDEEACQLAGHLDVPYLTIVDVLERWISVSRPDLAYAVEFIDGMAEARFRLSESDRQRLEWMLRSH